MVRSEFILTGCILVLVSLVLATSGYDRIQPTPIENLVSFTEQVTGTVAPANIHAPKTMGYILLVSAGIAFVGGLGFILNSRASPSQKN